MANFIKDATSWDFQDNSKSFLIIKIFVWMPCMILKKMRNQSILITRMTLDMDYKYKFFVFEIIG